MPTLPTQSHKTDSILVSSATGQQDVHEEIFTAGGKWEDEEERRFFEDVQDLRDFVPKSFLGIDEKEGAATEAGDDKGADETEKEREKVKKEREEEEVRKLEEELNKLKMEEERAGDGDTLNGHAVPIADENTHEDEDK